MSYHYKLTFGSLDGLNGVVNLCSPESERLVNPLIKDTKHNFLKAQEVQELGLM